MTTFLSNRAIYETVIRDAVPAARERLWIATADIKDMYVETGGRDMVPFLEVLDGLLQRGVEIRLIHAKEPGPNWREDFEEWWSLAYQGFTGLTGLGAGHEPRDIVFSCYSCLQ